MKQSKQATTKSTVAISGQQKTPMKIRNRKSLKRNPLIERLCYRCQLPWLSRAGVYESDTCTNCYTYHSVSQAQQAVRDAVASRIRMQAIATATPESPVVIQPLPAGPVATTTPAASADNAATREPSLWEERE